MRIVLCYPVESRHVEQIAQAAPSAEVVDARQDQIARELFDADIYCGHAKVPVDWPGVVRQGRLGWIQSSAAGMDHCLVPSVIDSEIVVTSASGVLADQVAEHAMALMTAFFRSLPVFFQAQQRKEFVRRPTGELHGKTVGIVGFGGVGRRLAELLAPFGGRILATDMFPADRPSRVEALWSAESLERLCGEVDVLILCAPLNAMTTGMIDRDVLASMQRGSLLVNMARGGLVVHDDLVESLESGHLGGALVDVTEPEPLPADSPLWEMPEVILTPHVAGQAAWRIDQMTDLFCRNLRRWQASQPLINHLTDKHLGFPKRDGHTLLWTDVRSTVGSSRP